MTKNFKGGYKIVSLNGNDLASGDSFVVNGLYENLVNSYKKPILVTEIVIDGEKQQDSFAVVKQSDGGYKIDVYDYALTVTSEDSVSAVALPEITSIGDGLDLTDGELSASGGSGKIYLHMFNLYETSPQQVTCRVTLYTTRKEPFSTIDDFLTFLYQSITQNTTLDVRGTYVSGSNYYPYQYIQLPPSKPTGTTTFKIWYLTSTGLSGVEVAPSYLTISGERIIEV